MSADKIVPSAIAKAAEQRGVKRRRFVCSDGGARGKFYAIDEERRRAVPGRVPSTSAPVFVSGFCLPARRIRK